MEEKRIVIFGPGKIGRGFVADIFDNAGYKIDLIGRNRKMMEDIGRRGWYLLYKMSGTRPEDMEKKVMPVEACYQMDDPGNARRIVEAGIFCMAVFPGALDFLAALLADCIRIKIAGGDERPLNVIICVNLMDVTNVFRGMVYAHLSEAEQRYADAHLGLCNSSVKRLGTVADEWMLGEDEYAIKTDDTLILPIDGRAFIGPRPNVPQIDFMDNFEQEYIHKLYIHNMTHSSMAYFGQAKGYDYAYQAFEDKDILQIVKEEMYDVEEAIFRVHGYKLADSYMSIGKIVARMENPIVQDTILRVGKEPLRKLAAEDRLAGPILLVRRTGLFTYYLTKAIAYGMRYFDERDPESAELQRIVAELGFTEALKKVTGLTQPEIVYMCRFHYARGEEGFVAEDIALIHAMSREYELAFIEAREVGKTPEDILRGSRFYEEIAAKLAEIFGTDEPDEETRCVKAGFAAALLKERESGESLICGYTESE